MRSRGQKAEAEDGKGGGQGGGRGAAEGGKPLGGAPGPPRKFPLRQKGPAVGTLYITCKNRNKLFSVKEISSYF